MKKFIKKYSKSLLIFSIILISFGISFVFKEESINVTPNSLDDNSFLAESGNDWVNTSVNLFGGEEHSFSGGNYKYSCNRDSSSSQTAGGNGKISHKNDLSGCTYTAYDRDKANGTYRDVITVCRYPKNSSCSAKGEKITVTIHVYPNKSTHNIKVGESLESKTLINNLMSGSGRTCYPNTGFNNYIPNYTSNGNNTVSLFLLGSNTSGSQNNMRITGKAAGSITITHKGKCGLTFKWSINVTNSSTTTTTPANQKEYTMSFNGNGGSPVPSPQKCTTLGTQCAAIQLGSLTKPTKTGYVFKGWLTQYDYNTNPNDCSKVKTSYGPFQNMTMYACWEAKATANLSITTNSLPSGTVGKEYTIGKVWVSGGTEPYNWSATGLPSGLSIESGTGAVRGTPTKAGTFDVKVTVKDSKNTTVSKTLKITIESSTTSTTKSTTTTTTTKANVVPEPPKSDEITQECMGGLVNGVCQGVDRYAQSGASFSGLTVSCGDLVRVTTCQTTSASSEPKCVITAINGAPINTPTQVKRQKLGTGVPSCGTITRYVGNNATYYSDSSLTPPSKQMKCGSTVTFFGTAMEACLYGKLINGSTTAYQYCKVNYNGSTVYADRNGLMVGKPVCNDSTTTTTTTTTAPTVTPAPSNTQICIPTDPKSNIKSSEETKVKVCYNYSNGTFTPKGADENSIYTCADGYRLIKNEDPENGTCNQLTNSSSAQECYKTFIYRCMSASRPRVAGAGSLVTGSNKIGTITINGKTDNNVKLKGYFVTNGEASPTVTSKWTEFENENYFITLQKSAGTYYVWVMNELNVISYPVTLVVHDSDITTTLGEIKFTNPDGTGNYALTPVGGDNTTAFVQGISQNNVQFLSNSLNRESTIASGFDMFTTAYELTVQSNKIAVYATLTSDDAKYVDGFEPRTVDLDYGRNVILVKVENKKGKIRTYTFTVNRTDNRESINTLSSLTVSKGKINFDQYVSDYTISVPKNTKTVSINGTLKSEKSAFIEGYEPRIVPLNNDITSAVLKTISEAGTIRNYVITFIKTGAESKETLSNSTYLSSLTVPGTELMFDRNTTTYSLAVSYETTDLPVFALPETENAKVTLSGNVGLKVGANLIEVMVSNGSKNKLYTIYVNRKQDGLGISTDTTLSSLTVKDYDINFDPDVKDYSLEIKREKSLLLSATPNSDRSEIYMYGNNDLNVFSAIRIKVIAENGDTGLYSLDIIKDAYNKNLEITVAAIGGIIILGGVIIIIVRKRHKLIKDYVGK